MADILGPTPTFAHTTFTVKDLDASLAWWDKMFGFKPYIVDGTFMIMITGAQVMIELMDGGRTASQITKVGAETTGVRGFVHASFIVDNAEAARQVLAERGAVTSKAFIDPAVWWGGPTGLAPDLKLCYFWDPDGNQFELRSGTAHPGHVTGGANSVVISRPESTFPDENYAPTSQFDDIYAASAPPSIFGPKLSMHHSCFLVKDLEASVVWYDKMLGFKEYSRMDSPKIVMMRNGHCYIELMDGSKAASQVTSEGLGSGIRGYFHTSFVVPDAEKAMATFVERGGRAISHGHPLMGGPNGLGPTKVLTFFWDLDGNVGQFMSGITNPGRVTGTGKNAVTLSRGWPI